MEGNLREDDIRKAALEFKRARTIAEANKEMALARAKAHAARLNVVVWVYATKAGLVMDTARPQVQEAWRVTPEGETLQLRSGQDV